MSSARALMEVGGQKLVDSSSHQAYIYEEAGDGFAPGRDETWWMSYHYQLEEFVNRIEGRETRYWIEGQGSINSMRMSDMAYEKSGLGLRPNSECR
jgi:hypothetical protein